MSTHRPRHRSDRPREPRHDPRVSLSVLATVDPVLRESATMSLILDSPRTVVIRHDIRPDDGTLHRVVVDASGVVEDVTNLLEHACLSCAVREDALPTIARLAEDGRWDLIVLALPVGAESLPATRALCAHSETGEILARCRVTAAAAVVALDDAEEDLLGEDLLGDRGLNLTDDDTRSVGEALAAQLEHVDLVVTTGENATGAGLVDRLRATETRRIDGLHGLTAADLTAVRHDAARGERRANPMAARGPGGVAPHEDDRSWTLELHTSRPMHPERMLEHIEALGTGRLRSRGVFWVPNRPDSACLWDGAGGQLMVGDLGPWHQAGGPSERHTRIVVVGTLDADGHDPRPGLLEAFSTVVATPEEIADGGLAWLGKEDVLEPWLGARGDADVM